MKVRRPGTGGIRPKARQTDRGCDAQAGDFDFHRTPRRVTGHHDASRRRAAEASARRAVQFAQHTQSFGSGSQIQEIKMQCPPATGGPPRRRPGRFLPWSSVRAQILSICCSVRRSSLSEASITGNDCNAARRLRASSSTTWQMQRLQVLLQRSRSDADSTSCK